MELFRTRDVVTLVKGTANPVVVDSNMSSKGWPGGQAVTWVDSQYDEFKVTYSDGTYGGFLLWGSYESSDLYTAFTGSQPAYNYAICCTGAWVISTSTYEKYTYASRTSGGPLVPNVFTVGARLTFSLRGYLSPEDEWTASNDPRGANELYIAYVIQAPSASNNNYLMVQTSI